MVSQDRHVQALCWETTWRLFYQLFQSELLITNLIITDGSKRGARLEEPGSHSSNRLVDDTWSCPSEIANMIVKWRMESLSEFYGRPTPRSFCLNFIISNIFSSVIISNTHTFSADVSTSLRWSHLSTCVLIKQPSRCQPTYMDEQWCLMIHNPLFPDGVGTNLKYRSGQIIIVHQPKFPWNRGFPLLNHHLGAQNSCEVAMKFDQIDPYKSPQQEAEWRLGRALHRLNDDHFHTKPQETCCESSGQLAASMGHGICILLYHENQPNVGIIMANIPFMDGKVFFNCQN